MKHTLNGVKTGEWRKIKCPQCSRTNVGRHENCLICQAQLPTKQEVEQQLKSFQCVQCGANMKKGQKFCDQCGRLCETPVQSPVCPDCGVPIKTQQKFCVRCGTQFHF